MNRNDSIYLRKLIKESTSSLIKSKQIARWKILNPLENIITHFADSSNIWKIIYYYFYVFFDNRYFNAGLKSIKEKYRVV